MQSLIRLDSESGGEFDGSRIMVTGTDGLLGSYIDFGIKTNKETLDILDRDSVTSFVKSVQPDAIIHLAAATNTDACESDPTNAYYINSVGTMNLALAAEAVGAVLVYVSTSRVFDGNKNGPYVEEDVPHPHTIYGKSKYIGEVITAQIVSEYIIVRGCWMFGGGPERDDKFYGKVIKQLGNPEISAIGDTFGSPTYAKDFVGALKILIKMKQRGMFHVSNKGCASRADIVQHIIKQSGSPSKLVTVDRAFFPTGHLLPANEAVCSSRIELRPWDEALTEYMRDEWHIIPGAL